MFKMKAYIISGFTLGLIACPSSVDNSSIEDELGDLRERVAVIEAATGSDDIARLDADIDDLHMSVDRLSNALVFLGANDASWSINLGTTEELGDVTLNDSAVASAGTTVIGDGSMFGTTFEATGLAAGVYEIFFSVQWGIGINTDAITQRFTLDCSGVDALYQPRIQITAGDADAEGVNVAGPLELHAWIRAADGDDLNCALTKRTLDVAQDGSGILYNALNGPTIAKVMLLVPE